MLGKNYELPMHEFELIRKYFSRLSKTNKASLNLNDDVFFDKKKGLVISIDTYNEGSHFLDFKKPDLVIKKIIRSSISDLICKGVIPKFYFVSPLSARLSSCTRPMSSVVNLHLENMPVCFRGERVVVRQHMVLFSANNQYHCF